MKITTLQTKVKALTKLNLADLDFQGLDATGQKTQIEPQLAEIRKDLSNFSRHLRQQEKKYVTQMAQKQLNQIFGKLLDQYHGDSQKALAALEASVAAAAPKTKIAVNEPANQQAASNNVTSESVTKPQPVINEQLMPDNSPAKTANAAAMPNSIPQGKQTVNNSTAPL